MKLNLLAFLLIFSMVLKIKGQEMNELKKVKPYSITFSVSNYK